jgi:hypothetical protein
MEPARFGHRMIQNFVKIKRHSPVWMDVTSHIDGTTGWNSTGFAAHMGVGLESPAVSLVPSRTTARLRVFVCT